jgi:hypothetical protein
MMTLWDGAEEPHGLSSIETDHRYIDRLQLINLAFFN